MTKKINIPIFGEVKVHGGLASESPPTFSGVKVLGGEWRNFMNVFNRRVILVTGAASGIGRTTAIEFARRGARVIMFDIDVEGLQETKVLCNKAAPDPQLAESWAIFGDARIHGDLQPAFDKAEYYGLDHVVHCVGVSGRGEFHKLEYPEWNRVITTNLGSTYVVCQMALEQMVRTGERGSITVVASMSGLISNGVGFHCSHYNCSKSAQIGLLRALAVEYAEYGIRLNTVSPGPIDTPMLRAFKERNPRQYEHFVERIPFGGEPGSTMDVAEAIMYLATANFVTGSNLVVDGGFSAQ